MSRFITLKKGTNHRPVLVEDIVRFQGMGSYTLVYLKNGKVYMQCKYIGYWEGEVRESGLFMRVHKSHLVQHCFIVSFNKTDVLLKDNSHLDVSEKGYTNLQRFFA